MSSDYLYVSATKHGGLQSFHEPITLLQRNWKKIIDDQLQQQMDFEWNRAFENFSIDPHQYYLIPLTQLALKTDPLPGVSPEQSARLHEEISEAIYSSIVASFNKKEKESSYQSSIPLILIDKKGSHFQILYRTANGHYHYLKQKE